MPYDAKPTIDDVILSTWQERDRQYVILYLRVGDNGMGTEIKGWWDEECAEKFEDGFLDAGRGGIKDNNTVLAQSAFDHVRECGNEVLSGFEAGLKAAVAQIEGGLLAAYEAKAASDPGRDDEDEDERVERLMHETAADGMTAEGPLPALSDTRIHDVQEYLVGALEGMIPARAPSP